MIRIEINGHTYDLGFNLQYAQRNEDGAFQDKLKYRLTQQSNMFLAALQAIALELAEIRQVIDKLATTYIWAADDDTIMASDDDTILTFYTYANDLQERVGSLEENVQQLADQGVLTYKEVS